MPPDWVVDTNVLLRIIDPAEPPSRSTALAALERIEHLRVAITIQVAAELWTVATRPLKVNGFGMSSAQVDIPLRSFEDHFEVIEDVVGTFATWRAIVLQHGVRGIRAHDARLVACMVNHGVRQLLTFDVKDFSGFPEIDCIHPSTVARPDSKEHP